MVTVNSPFSSACPLILSVKAPFSATTCTQTGILASVVPETLMHASPPTTSSALRVSLASGSFVVKSLLEVVLPTLYFTVTVYFVPCVSPEKEAVYPPFDTATVCCPPAFREISTLFPSIPEPLITTEFSVICEALGSPGGTSLGVASSKIGTTGNELFPCVLPPSPAPGKSLLGVCCVPSPFDVPLFSGGVSWLCFPTLTAPSAKTF